VTPAARLNGFPDAGVSPWISVGGGLGHFSESSTLLFGERTRAKREPPLAYFNLAWDWM